MPIHVPVEQRVTVREPDGTARVVEVATGDHEPDESNGAALAALLDAGLAAHVEHRTRARKADTEAKD